MAMMRKVFHGAQIALCIYFGFGGGYLMYLSLAVLGITAATQDAPFPFLRSFSTAANRAKGHHNEIKPEDQILRRHPCRTILLLRLRNLTDRLPQRSVSDRRDVLEFPQRLV